MNRLYALFLLAFPFAATAQVTFTIDATGGQGIGTPLYTPQFITIMVGDIVQWNGVSGTHNVYGELDDFPNNPEGFSSGQPQASPWTFSKTFTLPGSYEFHCTQGNHSSTQHGIITVTGANGLSNQVRNAVSLLLYPVPATDLLQVELGGGQALSADILSMDGRFISSVSTMGLRFTVDVSALPVGAYVLRLRDREGIVGQRRFLKA